MELLALILGLLIVVTLFMPWVNSGRIKKLNQELESFRHEIHRLHALIANISKPQGVDVKVKPTKEPVAEDLQDEVVEKSEVVQAESAYYFSDEYSSEVNEPEDNNRSAALNIPRTPSLNLGERIQNSFEQNIATKLPVWIGAISLICAAFFLVKYSMELGWMKPSVRVFLGAIFGVSLLAAGQWVTKRKEFANSKRISQGLVGAGLVSLYVSVYASVHLYGLVPPLMAFGAMAVITGLAVILSLRHGQAIAIFGLLGGLLTPALMGSDEPNAMALFTYLFLLFSGMFVVLVKKGWWILATISIFGVFGWAGLWFALLFVETDAFFLLVFAMAVMGVVLSVTGKRISENRVPEKESKSIHGLNYAVMAGGLATIIWLSFEITLSIFDWSILGLMTVAIMALAYFKPAIYQKSLYADLAISLGLLFIWLHRAPLADSIIVIIGMGVLYIGATAFIMRKVSDPRLWAALQSICGISLFVIAYFRLNLPQEFIETYSMFWGALALAGSAAAIYQVQDVVKNYEADNLIQTHLLAIYTLVASTFISLGLAIELPWEYLPLAIAAQVLVTITIFYKTRIAFLKRIAMILIGVFAALNYKQFILFLEITLESLWGDYPRSSVMASYSLDAPIIQLGLPFLMIASAFWVLVKTDREDKRAVFTLAISALLLGLSTCYYMIREFYGFGYQTALAREPGFLDRAFVSIIFGASAVGFYKLMQYLSLDYLKPIFIVLLNIAVLRIAYFDLFILNPYIAHSQLVGNIPLFNGVTLIYGFGILLTAWILKQNFEFRHINFYKAFGFICLFALISLNVRQFFNGSKITEGTMTSGELYSYSVAWLVTGLALLTVGIIKVNKTARMASLAFIILAVVKVFLFDAAELEGLYRVFSFLGLGVSLIGLSYFYTKFVFSEQNAETKA